jgi:glycerol-3-phosphate dehydrogenase (NAD(P)+)
MSDKPTVGVIGGGAWGTTLAILANRVGNDVTFCTRNENVIESIRERRVNEIYLPDVFLDPSIKVTSQLAEVCHTDMLIIALPAQYFRPLCIAITDLVRPDVPVVICSKGIERGSLAFMSEIAFNLLPKNPVAVLSGPNFAREAAEGKSTATTIACTKKEVGEQIIDTLGGKHFRPYYTADLLGTQIGGAVKNVIAIACGIALGMGLGENARAAVMTRGLTEMARLAVAKGGNVETLMGLSGLGDLSLSCSSLQSRNMALGYAIGQGKAVSAMLSDSAHGLTEGVATAESVSELASKMGVSMPISQMVHQVLSSDVDVGMAISILLERPLIDENI